MVVVATSGLPPGDPVLPHARAEGVVEEGGGLSGLGHGARGIEAGPGDPTTCTLEQAPSIVVVVLGGRLPADRAGPRGVGPICSLVRSSSTGWDSQLTTGVT